MSVPTPCLAGQYSNASASACTSCSSGYACGAAGTNYTEMLASECAPGQYAGVGWTACANCSAGYVCSTAGAASGVVKVCPMGTYSLAGSAACTNCSAGQYGSAPGLTTASCSGLCAIGFYGSASGLTTANCSGPCYGNTTCPPGSTTAFGATCPAGTYVNVSTGVCRNCTAGYSCPLQSTYPTVNACPPGTFSLAGAAVCANCSAGRYGNSSVQVLAACTGPCDPGRYGSVSGLTVPSCTGLCAPGYACPAGSTSPTAVVCPPGQYSAGGAASCSNCSVGYYGSTPGATNASCDGLCAAGSFGAVGGQAVATCSGACTAGYVCPSGSTNSTLAVCPPGTFSLAGSSVCTNCSVGYYCPTFASPQQLVCPLGFACAAGTVAPVACSRGHWCPAGTSISTALSCVTTPMWSAAWSRASTSPWSLTLVAGTTVTPAPIVAVGDPSGLDGDCNSQRLPGSVSSAGVTAVTLADVTGDNLVDMMVVEPDGTLTVLAGNTSGFVLASSVPCGAASAGGCNAVCAFDASGDGVPDVVAFGAGAGGGAVLDGSSLSTVLAVGSPAAALSSLFSVQTGLVGALFFDFYGSPSPDVMLITNTSVRGLWLDPGLAAYSDVSASVGLATVGAVTSAFVGGVVVDIDNDGSVDVLVFCGTGQHVLLINSGSGAFTVVSTLSRGMVSSTAGGSLYSAGFGDIDNDGDADVAVSTGAATQLFTNNGTGWFSPGQVWPVGGAVALVDVNSDGVLDLPLVGYVNPQPSSLASASLYIRVLDRAGSASQFGATVCVRCGLGGVDVKSALTSCRVIDGGGSGTRAQLPYDVHFSAAAASATCGAVVSFVNGRVHNATTSAAFGQVRPAGVAAVVLRDVPSVRSLVVSPSSGRLRVGSVLSVTATVVWSEAGLLPAPGCCVVNGVNVSQTFVNRGLGNYSLQYVIVAGNADVWGAAPDVLLPLADPVYADAVSDAAVTNKAVGPWAGFSIDAHPPQVTLTCVPWNNTVRLTNNDTVCASCGIATNESAFGCALYYRLGASAAITAMPVVDATSASLNVSSVNGDHVVLTLWAIDNSGNVGPQITLTWTVDSLYPVTVWPTVLDATINITSTTSPQYVFGCTRDDCHFSFSYDGAPLVAVGSQGSGAASTAAPTSLVHTTVVQETPKWTNVPSAVFAVAVTTNGSAALNASVEVRVDGGSLWQAPDSVPGWSFNASSRTLAVTGLSDGEHSVVVGALLSHVFACVCVS